MLPPVGRFSGPCLNVPSVVWSSSQKNQQIYRRIDPPLGKAFYDPPNKKQLIRYRPIQSVNKVHLQIPSFPSGAHNAAIFRHTLSASVIPRLHGQNVRSLFTHPFATSLTSRTKKTKLSLCCRRIQHVLRPFPLDVAIATHRDHNYIQFKIPADINRLQILSSKVIIKTY